ncbi:MAG: hypothetical protein ERJ67_10180 [Aphanocapsa feldmannii 277cV]|uniref:Uncharacterized protein n=1 Tax=Aphanocapsa feldmannii 277cV TaxID=2507553 RepID=A0A524RL54_9CHRO|nr:MAG: hypothetical protein ERJ67_10180 [Aphanocapsa feldmannii 277cV]
MPLLPSRSNGASCSSTCTASVWPGWEARREKRAAASSLVPSRTSSPALNCLSLLRSALRWVMPTRVVAASRSGLPALLLIG